MHIDKNVIPTKIDVPGAKARQVIDFGTADGYGTIAGEYFSLAAGTDIAPLLEGLEGDSCHSPHWGYVIEGSVTVTYTDRTREVCSGGELFYWPPGHTVRVDADADVVLFSPQHEHVAVLDHMLAKMGA
jgi:hypothetical protein